MDSGVAARLLRLTPEKLAHRHPAALTELGHLVETFVVGELIKQASWMDGISGTGHWRTRDGDEVDLVIERDDGAVVTFEIKAAQRVAGGISGPSEGCAPRSDRRSWPAWPCLDPRSAPGGAPLGAHAVPGGAPLGSRPA